MQALYRKIWQIVVRFFPKLKGLDSTNKDVVRRTFSSIMMRILRTGISFVFNVLLIRMLGAEGNGVYALAYTITRVSTIIGRVGLDQTVVRFTAASAAQGDWKGVGGVYRHAVMICLSAASLASLAVILAAPLFANVFSEPQLIEPMRWMALSIVPWSLLWLHSYFLQGIERIEESIFVQTMGVPIVNIPFLLVLTGAFGIVGAAMSFFIATLIVALLGFVLWRRYTPQLADIQAQFDRSTLLQTSMPLFWMDLTMVLIGSSDNLLLGIFSSSDTVGIYDAAKRISVLTSAFMGATVYVATPKFAAMYARGEHDKLEALARNVAKLTTVLALPYLSIFLLVPGTVMSVYGEEFRQGGIVLFLLAIGQFINAATGATGHLLIMTGYGKVMRNITFGANALKITLFLLLIPPFGYIGAALATMIADSTRELLAVYFIYRRLSMITLPLPGWMTRRLPPSTPITPHSLPSV